MATQIIFKIEDKLKKAAQRKAREEGITLSDFYKSATKSFVEGKMRIGIITEELDNWSFYTKESVDSFKRGIRDFKKGKIRRVV